MKTLEIIYWLRLALGIAAALLCAVYGLVTNTINVDSTVNVFLNGVSIASVTYLISYYAIRFKFLLRVEEPRKLLTTGIGIYIVSWIVIWVLLYTLIAGAPSA